MYYDCDLDVVKLSFSTQTLLKLFADISKEASLMWDDHSLFDDINDALAISYSNNEFITNKDVLICNTVIKNIDRQSHMFYKLPEPLNYKDDTEQKDIRFVFVLISPKDDGVFHLRRLSRISRLMQNSEFYNRLKEFDEKDSIRAHFMYPDLEEKAA